ncbi:MAG TPA: YdcF family protein [Bacteroidales bacterium]|nr:YdcF family protein [Bacteroidales bacterium]HNS45944.1 YdcF family protein [Bacteroidales bacterium]
MFFTLSKIVSYFLSPLFWIFSLFVLVFFVRKHRSFKWLFLGSLILFYLFSNRFLVDEALRSWEYPLQTQSSFDSSYDAAIVLGGNILNYDHPTHRFIFRENADKILQAIDLYENGRVKRLMLSGGPGDLFIRDQYEAANMRKYLLSIGVPDSVILVDSVSDNTFENAENSAAILKQKIPGGRYLLITTALHMRRAEGCLIKAGLDVTPYVSNKLTGKRRSDIEHLLIPQTVSFVYWHALIHERVGYRVYKMKGYL